MIILNVLYNLWSFFGFLRHVLDFSDVLEERTGPVSVPEYDLGK
jgi:hypothetical protein